MNKVPCMVVMLLAMLSVLPVFAQSSDTGEAAPPTPSLDTLLVSLTKASLRETSEIVDQLEAAAGRDMLPLFNTMLAGDLYFDEATLQLMKVTKNRGEDVGEDVFSGDSLGVVEGRQLEKVRVNNRLRGQLRRAIARINLIQGDDGQRRTAARAMLDNINDSSADLLTEALAKEQNKGVSGLIEIGLAMHTLEFSAEREARIEAISTLSGRLENPVRNLLASYAPDGFREEVDPEVSAAAAEALAAVQEKMEFYRFLEQLFFGLSLGSVLLLAAVGLAVTFGVMGVINMAHGEMLMLGAYTTYVVQQLMPDYIGASLLVSVPAAFLVAALAGMLIQRFVIRYLAGRPLETLLATFGISLILQQTVRTVFSPLNRRVVSPDWMSGSMDINPVLSLTYNRLYILVFALIVFFLLRLVMNKTHLGLQVRAVSQNRNMAKAMGIRTDWVDALTFGLGSGIAGIAGVALSQLTNVGPNLGQGYIIDSFMVVVFGGVGNLLGTLVGAFTLGVANKFLEPVTGAVLAKILMLVFIILFIQKRPRGLFPQKGRAAE